MKKTVLISQTLLLITKDDECKYDHHHILFKSLSDSFFASESSQQSKSVCDTPVRQISNHCFRLICSSLRPLLFLFFVLPDSSGNIPISFSCAPFPLHPLTTPPSPPPIPCPESGRPQRHHSSLGDNRYKEGLGSLVAAAQCASPPGKD